MQSKPEPIKRGKRDEKKGRINVRIQAAQHGWLRRAAAKRRVTVGVIVREIVESAWAGRHAK